MAAADLPSVDLFLTGFGPFARVDENPTQFHVKDLIQLLREQESCSDDLPPGLPADLVAELRQSCQLQDASVLDVSVAGCLDYFAQMDKHHVHEADELQQQQRRRRRLFVHLGVHAGSHALRLERFGYNLKDFSVPDNSGAQPRGQPVVDALPLGRSLGSRLDLVRIATNLAGHQLVQSPLGENGPLLLETSEDPGRFLCNHIYFSSLLRCKVLTGDVDQAVFIHFPSFGTVSRARQLGILLLVLRELVAATCAGVGSKAAEPEEA